MDILQILLSESFWSASIRIATPLIFGVLGALICEKSGVLNLGIEGIFVAGAMVGWMAVWLGAGLWGGVLAAALAGAFFGFLHGILTVPLGLSQHVSGLGITLFATSCQLFLIPYGASNRVVTAAYYALSSAGYSDFVGFAFHWSDFVSANGAYVLGAFLRCRGLVHFQQNRTGCCFKGGWRQSKLGGCARIKRLCAAHWSRDGRIGFDGAWRRVFNDVCL
jgi:ABC-type uncharacterized transport system permease subunit